MASEDRETSSTAETLLIVKLIKNCIILLFMLFFIFIGCYIIYIFVTKKYPRPFTIGRTYPIEAYMMEHVAFLCRHIEALLSVKDKLSPNLRTILEEIDAANVLPEDATKQLTPDNTPFIYMYYIFPKALTSTPIEEPLTKYQKMELNLIRNFFTIDRLTDESSDKPVPIYNSSGTEVTPEAAQLLRKKTIPLRKLSDYFKKLDCQYRGFEYDSKKDKCTSNNFNKCNALNQFPEPIVDDPVSEMARLHLWLLTFKYLPSIERAYNMRKSGGIGNFIIFNLYMDEYKQYVFKETIPPVWKRFIKDIKSTADTIVGVLTSDPVRNFMVRLPLTLTGTEGFIDTPPNVVADIYEQEEHFVGVLKSIGKVFSDFAKLIPNVAKVFLGLVHVITNPLKVIAIVIGAIVGFLLYVLYSLIVAMSILMYIPAFFWVLAIDLKITIIWTLLFCVIALVYVVLWILDFGTGGLIMRLLRCETAPNGWHDIPGWIYNNQFTRKFMCSFPCHRKYKPESWGCLKLPKYQAPFCPQQLIFNIYISHLKGKLDEHPSLKFAPNLYNFKPNIKYHAKDTENKKKEIDEFYNNRRKFRSECDSALAPYNFVTKYLCENMKTIVPGSERMMPFCQSCYCGHYNGKCNNGKADFSAFPTIRTFKTNAIITNNAYYKRIFQEDIDKLNKTLPEGSTQIPNDDGESKYYLCIDGYQENKVNETGEYSVFPESPQFCLEEPTDVIPKDGKKEKKKILYALLFMLLVLITITLGFALLYQTTQSVPLTIPDSAIE
jgi:hypothetical protein